MKLLIQLAVIMITIYLRSHVRHCWIRFGPGDFNLSRGLIKGEERQCVSKKNLTYDSIYHAWKKKVF